MVTRIFLLLTCVILAAHGPVVVGGRTWDDAHRIAEVTPAQLETAEAIGEGRLPVWWERAGLGAPLWAEPAHASAYPGWWPAAVFPGQPTRMLDVLAIAHALWAALGAALLARRLGADELGAVVAGGLLGAADITTTAMIGGTIGATAHLPWVAWAADGIARTWRRGRAGAVAVPVRAVRRGDRDTHAATLRRGDREAAEVAPRRGDRDPEAALLRGGGAPWRAYATPVVVLAVAIAAICYAGRFAVAFDAIVIALVVALARAPRPAVAGWCAVAIGVGVALAAMVIVPAVHHLAGDVGARAGDPASGSPWSLLGMILPGGETLGGDVARTRLVETGGGFLGGGVFLGGAALLLAIAAIAKGGEGRRPLGIAALGFIALAAGVLPPLDLVLGFDRAAYLPTEHLAAAAVLLVALAGVGFSEMAAHAPDKKTLRAVVIAGAALAVAFAALAAARPLLARALDSGDLDAAVAQVDRVLAHGAFAITVALATLGLLLASSRRHLPAAIPAAALLCVAHAVFVGRLVHPTTPRGDLDATPTILSAAATSEHGDAIAAVAETGLAPRLYLPTTDAIPDTPAVDAAGVRYVARPERRGPYGGVPGDSLVAAVPTRFDLAAVRWAAPGRQSIEDTLWFWSGAAGGRMFDRYAIDLAVVPSSIAVPAVLPVLSARGAWSLVATRARRPRALLATEWAWFPDDAAAIRAIFPPPGETPLPLDTVARIGDGEPSPDVEGAPRACDVRADAPERVVVHCDPGPGGMLLLLDAWAPGWSVTVDGEPADLERVDVVARGVAVGDGEHTAVFTYTPPGLPLGRWISGFAALALVGLLAAARVGPRPASPGV